MNKNDKDIKNLLNSKKGIYKREKGRYCINTQEEGYIQGNKEKKEKPTIISE